MNLIKSLVLMLVSIFMFLNLGLEAKAANSFSGIETKIFSESNTFKVKKMQLTLSEFWLYDWPIDWSYISVQTQLLNYQKKAWLIVNDNDHWAWYFGVKTLNALKNDYPDNFDEVVNKYLKMDTPSTEVRYFYVTAYYSPLPGQKRYTTGSYAWDVRLNWNGTHAASWKAVHAWILAAPRNYSFWTKIELEWIGVWVVEDRGWAIVNHGERWFEYDRIDVWMWYGDEWLERALKWWKRKIKWKVVPETRAVSIEFDDSVVVKYKNLSVNAETPIKENVVRLQELLSEVKLYNWPINWDFSSVKSDLVSYQLKKWIISSSNSDHAWYFWPKTYAALRSDFGGGIFKLKNNKLDEDVLLTKEVRDKLDAVHNKITNIINKKYGHNYRLVVEYRQNLRKLIEIQLNKTKQKSKKDYLKYLKSVI